MKKGLLLTGSGAARGRQGGVGGGGGCRGVRHQTSRHVSGMWVGTCVSGCGGG